MFDRLQQKWKVSPARLFLILCTFALGGSITGYAGKKIMNALGIGSPVLWLIVYILLITLLWPMAVLLVSIPLGQWKFFTAYLKKMGVRMGMLKAGDRRPETGAGSQLPTPDSRLKKIAVFASGAGSNARAIIDHFRKSATATVALVVCNKPGAGVVEIAEKEGIPVILLEKEGFFNGNTGLEALKAHQIDLVVLAGFLWKIPAGLIKAYPERIINIHPALLPAYGGKGMYGRFVHEAVIAAKEPESGITIHYVDEFYDHGRIICQEKTTVAPDDTPESLAQKIHMLEHAHYPNVIEQVLKMI